jgi:hypothetical protein
MLHRNAANICCTFRSPKEISRKRRNEEEKTWEKKMKKNNDFYFLEKQRMMARRAYYKTKPDSGEEKFLLTAWLALYPTERGKRAIFAVHNRRTRASWCGGEARYVR